MKHPRKTILTAAGLLLLVPALFAGGYILSMDLQYYRIADNTPLVAETQSEAVLRRGAPYTALTYNIGFGAYTTAFSFFLDTGMMADGTEVRGTGSRAQSREIVLRNTEGALNTVLAQNPDFCLFQEADVNSTRSFQVDQTAILRQGFPGWGSVFALNFHSAYLLYPPREPHGSVNSGLLTFSRFFVGEAVRRSYPVDDGFFIKFFDLDRCFALLRLPVEGGRELVLINSHMSAYDAGGTVRERQLELLCGVMAEEYARGNYVIVGGDFNHALCGTLETFPSQQKVPGWVYPLDASALPDGIRVAQPDNVAAVPTCRSTDLPYEQGVNYTVVIDGFFVSDNVTAAAHDIDTGFAYSDHNPVLLTFTLN